MRLKDVLQKNNVSQAWLAEHCDVSPATISLLVTKGQYPTKPTRPELEQRIVTALEVNHISVSKTLFIQPVESEMLLRKQHLTPEAKKAFGLFQNPFTNDLTGAEDVFTTPDARYVRESLMATAKFGGFVAVVGESGSGKSTLRRDLIDRIRREDLPIVTVEPYVLGMEDNDRKGKTMKATSIADAIIVALSPLERPKASMEAKSRQLHKLLKDSSKAGFNHCLIIEEAHALSIPTLKHLKRFFELEDGFKKLLSIVLIGQTELETKLSQNSPEIREVVQRCELVKLTALDGKTEDYLKFKFGRVGKDINDVFEPGAIETLRNRLTFQSKTKTQAVSSITYPLMLNNVVTAALNLTAALGFNKISSDIIKEI